MAYDGPFPLDVADGGTGASTLTGILKGNGTSAVTATAITQYSVITGGASNAPNSVAPTATSGIPVVSQGSSAQPIFGTAVVAGGGTGDVSFTAFAPVCGGTTTTGALQSATTGISTTGFVLTSTGAASLPTFQAVGIGSLVFDGDSGTASPSSGTITFNANSNAGSSVLFSASGSTVSLKVTDASSNTIIGSLAGNGSLSGNENTAIGVSTLHALTSGIQNTTIGYQCGESINSGMGNVGCGVQTLAAVTTGNSNTAIGFQSGQNFTTGGGNILIGSGSGSSYTGGESSNILLDNTGTLSESFAIRIGTGGRQTSCYIAGIEGVSVSNKNYVTINTSSGQLGSEAASTLFSINIQTFTGTGTYTPTAGMAYCIIECLGGGGAGGGAATTTSAQISIGAGGGSGEYARGAFSASSIGASKAVTIGGAGSAASGTTGGNGGNTSVGVLISANGGTGGGASAASSGAANANGGAGGTGGSGGSVRCNGQTGTPGVAAATQTILLGG